MSLVPMYRYHSWARTVRFCEAEIGNFTHDADVCEKHRETQGDLSKRRDVPLLPSFVTFYIWISFDV